MRREHIKRIANKRITCGQLVSDEDVSRNYWQHLKWKVKRYFQGIEAQG